MNSETVFLAKKVCSNPRCDLEYLVPNNHQHRCGYCSPECLREAQNIIQGKLEAKIRKLNKNISNPVTIAAKIHTKEGGKSWTRFFGNREE